MRMHASEHGIHLQAHAARCHVTLAHLMIDPRLPSEGFTVFNKKKAPKSLASVNS
jgi:hypothetical protein